MSLAIAAVTDAQLLEKPIFEPSFEQKTENALEEYRNSHLELYGSNELLELQSAHGNDYPLSDQIFGLDLFRSLAAYYHDFPFNAESIIDSVLTNAAAHSRIATNAALLGALEFYSHAPLTRNDVEAGLARLNSIPSADQAAAAVRPEILFWKAEGYQALGENSEAEANYREAIRTASDTRLEALSHFRLAELAEREEHFAEADSNFSQASTIRESPLRLLALLRLGAVERSERNYLAVLTTMDRADTLFHSSENTIRVSARDLNYLPPLAEELLLHSTEDDRIIGRTNDRSTSSPSQLVSPFYLSEIDLLRGSALGNLGRYAEATAILTQGENRIDGSADSAKDLTIRSQALFVFDALRFERGWSLFQRGQYKDAAAAFLELAVTDTSRSQYALLQKSVLPLRSRGMFFDPYLNDSLAAASHKSVPMLQPSVIQSTLLDTSFFFYNDFPERARYYAGVALARAGLLDEAAETLSKLALTPAMLYSDQALYQLALIRFEQHSYQAQKLLEPVSYEPSVRGSYASFLLGELAYRRNDYERAQGYFQNAFAYLPQKDSAVRVTAHLERGLSLIPLGNWKDAADELHAYLNESHEHILGRTDEALFWMGKAYLRASDYDSAEATFSNLLSEYPQSARVEDAQYNYAWSLFEANDFARAEPEFEKVLAIDTISRYAYDALARAGDAEYAMGNIPKSNILYNRATDRPGFNPLRITRATLMIGITRMKIDSERSAMSAFEYIARKFPESDIVDLADLDYALSAYAISLTSNAEDMVATVVRKYPKSSVAPKALYIAGEERVRHGDERGALHYYQQVIGNYANSSEAGPALFALQDALADLKRIPEAMAVADTFVSKNPNNPISPMVLVRAGEFQLRLKEPDVALATFRSFVSRYPTNPARPHAELMIGESELAAGDTFAAQSQLDTVTTRYDTLTEAASADLDLARIERTRGNIDSASLFFQRAYRDRYYSFDAASQAMFEYGEMLTEKHKNDSAVSVFLSISSRYPMEASISARGAIRAGELIAAHDPDSARSIFRSVIAFHSKDALGGAASVQIGETYLGESDWSKAAQEFTNARREFPLSVESEGTLLFGLARAGVHLGKKAEAIRILHELLGLHGALPGDRSSATTLLDELQPKAKPKAKKGGKK